MEIEMKKITTKMKIFIAILLVVIFLMYQIEPPTSTQPQTNNKEDVSYSIISDEHKRDIKRTVEVMLDHKISKEELEKISYQIKNSTRQKYDRTFIGYFLPHIIKENGEFSSRWALVSFNPDFKIDILEMTIDEELKLTETNRGNALGIWLDDNMSSAKYTIYKENEKTFIEELHPSGYVRTNEVKKSKIGDDIKYTYINNKDSYAYDNNVEIYAIINPKNEIKFHGSESDLFFKGGFKIIKKYSEEQ